MTDHDAIQRLWKVVSHSHGSQPDAPTHYLFSGNRWKEIIPILVDDGKMRATFRLDEEAEPRRIIVTLDYNGPDGPPDPHPIVLCGIYRLAQDTLEFSFGSGGEFPKSFAAGHDRVTLHRDHGPIPESKRPSGTPPLDDEILGRLNWDDNIHWYSGTIPYSGNSVSVSLKRDKAGSVEVALKRARHIWQNIETYLSLARKLAADKLLDLKNSTWLEENEKPVTRAEFMERMKIAWIVFRSDGKVSFDHHDGGLFWGHSIQISIDVNDICVGADI